MKFALSTEHRDFASSINALLDDSDTPAVIRAWSAGEHEPGRAIWRRLADLGVTALLTPEQYGGFGADAIDVAVAFEALGYHAMPGPLVESIAALPTLLTDEHAERWLPGLASGEFLGTLVMPPLLPRALDADVADVRLHLEAGILSEFTSGPSVDRWPHARSVDPARRLFTATQVREIGTANAERAINNATLALAAQLLGLGQRLLDDSVAYAKQRSQYDKPIGQYQAIKHLLADVATAVELARPLVHGGAIALVSDAATIERDVSAARVAAADAAYLAARTGLQVHGAIGYTAEHDLGLRLGKVRALQSVLGTQAFHRDRVLSALIGAA